MKYTVLWTPNAEDRLAIIWMSATDQNAISFAANTIDGLLTLDPDSLGEFVFDTVRRLSLPPLGADVEVIEADRIVYVLSVWTI
jgi:hypothetical protein